MTEIIQTFEIWKSIKLGTGLKDADSFRTALLNVGNLNIGEWRHNNDVQNMLTFPVSESEIVVNLVITSVYDLGFHTGATRKDIYQRAQELGLELCPAEVGPQLRLQYEDQPIGEWFLIAMEPIIDPYDHLGIFHLRRYHTGMVCLDRCNDCRPEYLWHAGTRWVFQHPK